MVSDDHAAPAAVRGDQRRRPDPLPWLVSGVLLLLPAAAGAGLAWPAPRGIVLAVLGALPGLALLVRGLLLVPDAMEAPPPAREILGEDQARLLDQHMALEARLEHAPVALYQIVQEGGTETVTPLNATARRLVAPGRASDPASLYAALRAHQPGRRGVIQYDSEQGVERALAAVSGIAIAGHGQRLAAVMPIENELEAAALKAWRELVHVLTHEIMNSLTPVASLSLTAHDLLDDLKPSLPADAAQDLSTALDAISRRAHSLAAFVDSYRSLSAIPEARPERTELLRLFARVEALVAERWRARGGRAVFEVEPESLEAMVDGGQIEQALINLIKNAYEATEGLATPMVTVTARLSRGARLSIEVWDNGPGVPDALVNQIFTPFFTTKEKGTGIGLAMVRQLVHGNGGTVRYAKPLRGGARFIMSF